MQNLMKSIFSKKRFYLFKWQLQQNLGGGGGCAGDCRTSCYFLDSSIVLWGEEINKKIWKSNQMNQVRDAQLIKSWRIFSFQIEHN